ncbi:MAG: competence/damage-inducible protein A [Sulfurovum sp.]|nr:competence/damage-inducible protein A [Sulfurovum sp.]
MTFFILIIGSEILNRRRTDVHFNFVTKTLESKGHTLSGSFVIADNPALIVNTIKFIASHANPILFSFGGIGSTPDDYTRRCVAIALRNGKMRVHKEARRIIKETLGERAYPYSIKMAELPQGAKLLGNPVNNMPAFYLDDRYFFMPGFPEMSHPMVNYILENILPEDTPTYRYTLTAQCRENEFIELMKKTPEEVEVSSLPKLHDGKGWQVSLSVASKDDMLTAKVFSDYVNLLENKKIPFVLEDEA